MGKSKGTVPRFAFLVIEVLTAVVLAGCIGTASENRTVASSPQPASVSPSGSTTVGCDLARPVGTDTPPPGPEDLVIGPLVYPGLGNGYKVDVPPDADADGVTYFKVGTRLPAESTVTVSIDAAARSFAGILTEQGPSVGYSSVTYEGCSANIDPGRVFWVGGFTLVGRQSACIPLAVQVKGEHSARHAMLSIGDGSCGN